MEEITELRTVRVDYKCPNCGEGYLRPSNDGQTINPPMYPHKCTNCEYTETFNNIIYPYITHQ